MVFCQNCGNQIAQGLSFCPVCGFSIGQIPAQQHPQSYPQPYQQPTQPPMRPKSKAPIIAAIIIVVAIIFIIAIFAALFLGGEENKTVTMSVSELEDDLVTDSREDYQGYDYYYTMEYKSLDPGDTLLLRDEITDISYDYYDDETYIELDWEASFYFEGDLTYNYDVYDTVIIEFHIIHVSFDEDIYGYTYHFEGEVPREQWDSDDNEYSDDPLPQSIIRHA